MVPRPDARSRSFSVPTLPWMRSWRVEAPRPMAARRLPHSFNSFGPLVWWPVAIDMVIKLSSPETKGFWELPILYEDADLLALDKPAGLPIASDNPELRSATVVELL